MRAKLAPSSLSDGEAVEIVLSGLAPHHVGQQLQVQLAAIDDIDSCFAASVPGTVSDDGRWQGSVELSLGRETAIELASVAVLDSAGNVVEGLALPKSPPVAILNASTAIENVRDARARRRALLSAQDERYSAGLGDENATDAIEHRVLCVVQRLLMRTPLRLPGLQVLPLAAGTPGTHQAVLLQRLVQELGWTTRVPGDWWDEQSRSAQPWTALRLEPVWAADYDAAAKLAWIERDRVLDVFALTRGGAALPLATIVEQPHEGPNAFRIYHETERYTGNVLGGFISGEGQHDLVLYDAALRGDPLLRLCVGLYRNARAESDADAAYFRFWSVLETLSDGRQRSGQRVRLLNGGWWPGKHGTTSYAAPRVYKLIADHLRAGIDEASVARPAADLYEAVRAWYARRNATAHYGRFVPGDRVQQGKQWYSFARKTRVPPPQQLPGGEEPWLWSLREATSLVLARETTIAGRALVPST